MKLYSMSFSANGRKAESLVGYLGVDAEVRQVDLRTGEQKQEDFLALNPNGRIPVLEDGEFVVWESNAVLLYLAGKHPDRNLVPTDLRERSQVERWLFWQSSHFGPAVGKLVFEKVIKKLRGLGDADPAVIEAAIGELHGLCALLDQQLAGKDYLCGSLSVADFAIGPWAELAPTVGFGFDNYPNVRAWVARVTALPGWVASPPLPV